MIPFFAQKNNTWLKTKKATIVVGSTGARKERSDGILEFALFANLALAKFC